MITKPDLIVNKVTNRRNPFFLCIDCKRNGCIIASTSLFKFCRSPDVLFRVLALNRYFHYYISNGCGKPVTIATPAVCPDFYTSVMPEERMGNDEKKTNDRIKI